jgi:2-keto-4-pentenoate hydratase/2-oxohepta-3-ene-1,7-dioic acid hydratase in catechol pathway
MTKSTEGLSADVALARFRDGDAIALGLVAAERIHTLTAVELGAADLNAFLEGADWARLRALATSLPDDAWQSVSDVTLTAPVAPRQVLQTGANYREHVIQLVASGLTNGGLDPAAAKEKAAQMMDERAATGSPYFFIGLPACVVGDDVDLKLPAASDTHDWELELAVVIGKPTFRVSREDALDHVAGYTICNDVSTREYTFRKDMKDIGSDWYRSKNAPGFLPTGPYLVPADTVDPANTHLTFKLNGEVKQDANTSDLLFDLPALIAEASQTAPLLPGDLLLTGSPAGNGQYWKRFLKDGDIMTGTIDGLGTQEVRCVAE